VDGLASVQLEKGVSSKNVKPVKLSFENLEFEVNITLGKDEQKKTGSKMGRQKIIKGVSGYALPGETLYIMGASGAGKTSLLNMLSDRISTRDGQTLSGEIKINDSMRVSQQVFGSLAAYVMQDDVLYDSFTP
jgi:ABC-type multidrug transport system ATPase subunit